MSYAEDILKLRKRMSDAVAKGVVNEDGKNIFEATLVQIMNDAEKNRQNCVSQAENFRRQASIFDGQAGAFASVVSIVYNVLNGFVTVAERDEEERARIEKEKATEVTVERDPEVTDAPADTKKKSNKKNK